MILLRPSGIEERHNKPWSLQLRYHESCGPTEYYTIANVSDDVAQAIISAGAPEWLFGEPDWEAREKARRREQARVLREQADELEK